MQTIFDAIGRDGFSENTLQSINSYVNDILDGTENISRFNLSEHAGLCTAGAPLIGAYVVACYARASLEAGGYAESSQGEGPANVFIDKLTALPICIDCIVKFL